MMFCAPPEVLGWALTGGGAMMFCAPPEVSGSRLPRLRYAGPGCGSGPVALRRSAVVRLHRDDRNPGRAAVGQGVGHGVTGLVAGDRSTQW